MRERKTSPGLGAATVTVVIRFADCELNLDRIVLRRGGEEIRVEPQVFDVLAYLVDAPRRGGAQGGAARRDLG